MRIDSLDHLVLTVADLKATVTFYTDILGMSAETFQPADGTCRTALKFGQQKINLHVRSGEFEPKAHHPTLGSADLCFLTQDPLEGWQTHLSEHNIAIEQGPVKRTGATGPILSLYVRDPDGNLIEISLPKGLTKRPWSEAFAMVSIRRIVTAFISFRNQVGDPTMESQMALISTRMKCTVKHHCNWPPTIRKRMMPLSALMPTSC